MQLKVTIDIKVEDATDPIMSETVGLQMFRHLDTSKYITMNDNTDLDQLFKRIEDNPNDPKLIEDLAVLHKKSVAIQNGYEGDLLGSLTCLLAEMDTFKAIKLKHNKECRNEK